MKARVIQWPASRISSVETGLELDWLYLSTSLASLFIFFMIPCSFYVELPFTNENYVYLSSGLHYKDLVEHQNIPLYCFSNIGRSLSPTEHIR